MTLARNAAFNLLGAAVPALLSIATLPYIVGRLGAADFGLLMLVTAIVGYFAMLDISVTAGSTKYVAEYNATGEHEQVYATVSFSLVIYICIGAFGMLSLLVFANPLVSLVFSLPPDGLPTAVLAIQVASVGFLLGQVQAYLQSLPGALMRYDLSGRVEAAFGTALPLLTVLVLAKGYGLVAVVVLRVALSLVQIFVLCAVLRRLLPRWRFAWPVKELRRKLLGFSGFAFLSRIAAITYANADRLLIGARVGVVALSHYSVPATVANRVMTLVFRLSGVIFPHTSALAASGRIDELRATYLTASRYLFFLNGIIALTLAILSYPILSTWLDSDFARQGNSVMTMIALTLWLDSLTNAPSLVTDGLGHPKTTGMFAVARALLGLCFIAIGVDQQGIVGAAAGHLLASMVMSAAFLFWVHGRTVPVTLGSLVRQAYMSPLLALLPGAAFMLAVRGLASGWHALLCVAGVAALIFAIPGWFMVLRAEHRMQIVNSLGLTVNIRWR